MAYFPKCQAYVPCIKNGERWEDSKKAYVKTQYDSHRVCAKKASRFVEVTLSKLFAYKKNLPTVQTLQICEDCFSLIGQNVTEYNRRLDKFLTRLHGLNGVVQSVILIDKPSEAVLSGGVKKEKLLNEFKAVFLTKMLQRNASEMDLEDWKKCFELTMEEFVVKSVMKS